MCETTATLREHLTALQEAYETLPEHSHELIVNGEKRRSIPLTFKTLAIGMAFLCMSKEAFNQESSTSKYEVLIFSLILVDLALRFRMLVYEMK